MPRDLPLAVQSANPWGACWPPPLQLVGHGESTSSWGAPGKLPLPGQYCYESLQMARYEQGQHFLAHEVCSPAPKISSLTLALICCC